MGGNGLMGIIKLGDYVSLTAVSSLIGNSGSPILGMTFPLELLDWLIYFGDALVRRQAEEPRKENGEQPEVIAEEDIKLLAFAIKCAYQKCGFPDFTSERALTAAPVLAVRIKIWCERNPPRPLKKEAAKKPPVVEPKLIPWPAPPKPATGKPVGATRRRPSKRTPKKT